MKYNHDWLHAQIEAGEAMKYIFFWGDRPRKDGTIGKSCFSQWFARGFEKDGIRYPTAEHWMMAEKARLFKDEIALKGVLESSSPAEAKKWGRKVKGFENTTWLAQRERIVIEGNLMKFGQDEDLWEFLDKTKERVLVEASPVDRIWGIGMAANEEGVEHPENWKGLNLLGYALMEVRETLRQ